MMEGSGGGLSWVPSSEWAAMAKTVRLRAVRQKVRGLTVDTVGGCGGGAGLDLG